MTLSDLVIDTNVFLHAQNRATTTHQDAFALVTFLLESDSLEICVDEGFSLIESANRSLICREYLDNFSTGSLGFAALSELARNRRIRVVSRKVSGDVRSFLNKLIPNKRDRTFVRVAVNSKEHILVSHDFTDFSQEIRDKSTKALRISIQTAEEVLHQV